MENNNEEGGSGDVPSMDEDIPLLNSSDDTDTFGLVRQNFSSDEEQVCIHLINYVLFGYCLINLIKKKCIFV
jgi:hypothetical protein